MNHWVCSEDMDKLFPNPLSLCIPAPFFGTPGAASGTSAVKVPGGWWSRARVRYGPITKVHRSITVQSVPSGVCNPTAVLCAPRTLAALNCWCLPLAGLSPHPLRFLSVSRVSLHESPISLLLWSVSCFLAFTADKSQTLLCDVWRPNCGLWGSIRVSHPTLHSGTVPQPSCVTLTFPNIDPILCRHSA